MRTVLVVLVAMVAALGAATHPANIAAAKAKVSVDGRVEMSVRFDLLAFVVDETPADADDAVMKALFLLPPETLAAQLKEAETRFRRGLKLIGGSREGSIDSLTFPTVADVQEWLRRSGGQTLPMMGSVIVKGRLPASSRTSSFRFPEKLDTVVLTTEFPYQEPISEPVDSDHASFNRPLPTPTQVAAARAAISAPRKRTEPKKRKKPKGG